MGNSLLQLSQMLFPHFQKFLPWDTKKISYLQSTPLEITVKQESEFPLKQQHRSSSQLLFGAERGTDRYSSPHFQRQWAGGVRNVILPGKFPDPDPSVVYRKSIHRMTPIHIISASSRVSVWICDLNNRWVKSHVTRQLPSGCIDVDVGEHMIFQAKVSTNLSSIFPPDLLFLVLSCSLIFLACSTPFCSNHTPAEDPSNANRGVTLLQSSTISGR